MDDRVLKFLTDISRSIDNIELFCVSRPKEFKTFCEDICFRSAVQWEIAVIGEAMNRILKIQPDIPITSARKIVNTRNFLIHGYDSLNMGDSHKSSALIEIRSESAYRILSESLIH